MSSFKEYLEQVQDNEESNKSSMSELKLGKKEPIRKAIKINNEMKPIFNYAKRLISKNKSQWTGVKLKAHLLQVARERGFNRDLIPEEVGQLGFSDVKESKKHQDIQLRYGLR